MTIRFRPRSTTISSFPVERCTAQAVTVWCWKSVPRPISLLSSCGIGSVLASMASPAQSMWNEVRRRSEEHTSELQSRQYLVCRLLLEKKKIKRITISYLYDTTAYQLL